VFASSSSVYVARRKLPFLETDRVEMPHLLLARRLENVAKTDEIGIDIRERVLKRIAHPGLRREVDDGVEALTGEQRRRRRTIGKIEPFDPERVRPPIQVRAALP
jgi:hypothetical protein